MAVKPPRTVALAVAREKGIARARDFAQAGVAPVYLRRLTDEGQLVRLGRGLYRLAESRRAPSHRLAEAARRVPQGVISLLSALEFHGLIRERPDRVWMTIGLHAWAPARPEGLRIIRATGEALAAGVRHHAIAGVSVPIYEPAKTLADCFKHRRKIGVEVAIEALRQCWRRRLCTVDELLHFAGICRVQTVMRPYMEATLFLAASDAEASAGGGERKRRKRKRR